MIIALASEDEAAPEQLSSYGFSEAFKKPFDVALLGRAHPHAGRREARQHCSIVGPDSADGWAAQTPGQPGRFRLCEDWLGRTISPAHPIAGGVASSELCSALDIWVSTMVKTFLSCPRRR